MELLKDRRVLIGMGVAAALIAGVFVAWSIGLGGGSEDAPPTVGGLVVEVAPAETQIDLSRELPCYAGGQLVGMASYARCAELNGVAEGQIDVGISSSGELAYGETGANLAPLPPGEGQDLIGDLLLGPIDDQLAQIGPEGPQRPPQRGQTQLAPPTATVGPTATCWRHSGNWVSVGVMPLESCVRTLFDGRCESDGGATYGRWGAQTLRLVPGRVEQSPDNANFRPLVQQGANCSIAGF
jgi:hypothetical protein